jgi:GST-like protein
MIKRVLGVLDGAPAKRRFAAGDRLTIADIAHFGWLLRREFAGVSLDAAPNVQRYIAELLWLGPTTRSSVSR